jgi:hypothetical protein
MARTITCPSCSAALSVSDRVGAATCPKCLARLEEPDTGATISPTPLDREVASDSKGVGILLTLIIAVAAVLLTLILYGVAAQAGTGVAALLSLLLLVAVLSGRRTRWGSVFFLLMGLFVLAVVIILFTTCKFLTGPM